jgi:hypothetical protein
VAGAGAQRSASLSHLLKKYVGTQGVSRWVARAHLSRPSSSSVAAAALGASWVPPRTRAGRWPAPARGQACLLALPEGWRGTCEGGVAAEGEDTADDTFHEKRLFQQPGGCIFYNKGGEHTQLLKNDSRVWRGLVSPDGREKLGAAQQYTSGAGCNVALNKSKGKAPVQGQHALSKVGVT